MIKNMRINICECIIPILKAGEGIRERGERSADTVPPKSSSTPFQRSRELPIAFTLLLMVVYQLTNKSRRGWWLRDITLKEKETRNEGRGDVLYRYKEPSLFVRLLSHFSFISSVSKREHNKGKNDAVSLCRTTLLYLCGYIRVPKRVSK